jgi:hypothetical protein
MTTSDDTSTMPEVLAKQDLARLLNKSTRTIDRLNRARLLPEPLIRGRWSRKSVERWLDGGTTRRGPRA